MFDFFRVSRRLLAFTRARIVDGFERAGIYPLNPDRFDFLVCWRELQACPQATPSRSVSPDSETLPPPGDPSSPARKNKTNRVLAQNTRLLNSPPATPSSLLRALKDSHAELVQYRARGAIQGGRIRDLQATKDAREKKKGDRRRVPVESTIIDQNKLNRLREERDARDAARAARGRGRGRGRSTVRGRRHGGKVGASSRVDSSSDSDVENNDVEISPAPRAAMPSGHVKKARASAAPYNTRSTKRPRTS
ncbi:hypothetical protein GGX14DRAFT_409344 [Mycena pura]|uniref:Uncharacterized protein n=1 Tax=Mycena pura TaxID=153505 RepID=A0AAD6UL53_9AGAR|nr:hypothetical protein GGX14DRAFT_409344 [Mycena pura]